MQDLMHNTACNILHQLVHIVIQKVMQNADHCVIPGVSCLVLQCILWCVVYCLKWGCHAALRCILSVPFLMYQWP